MEASRACGYRDDNPRLPTLSLGLSSVRLIVNQIEAEYARAVATQAPEISCEIVKYDPNFDEGYDDYNDFPFEPPKGRVWSRFAVNIGLALAKCIPSVTFENFGLLAVTTALFAPRMISYLVVYPFCRLVFGTLYPAYASYKAVRTKNLKEYVKWMMYWIVFALFTCTETFTDVFLSWFPFYYEVKIVLVLWLLSPATKGSSILYRKFVHPALCRREQEIDEYIAKAKDQGYHTVLNLGTKGVNYATTVIMQTAIKGGGGLVQQLRKSYSLSDLTECEPREEQASDEADDVLAEPRLIRRGPKSGPRRSASESNSRSPMYFPEVDVDVRGARSNRTDEPDFSHIKSSEDISSGYSSADNSASLTRTASLGAAARARARVTRTTVTTIKRPQAAEESEVIIEEPHDDDTFEYANMPPLVNAPSPIFLSHSDPPFLYQIIEDQIKIIQVLGNLPLSIESNKQPNNSDQPVKNAAPDETSAKKESVKKENDRNVEDTSVQITSEDNIILEPAGTASKNNNKDLDISETVVTYTNNNSTNIDFKETNTNKKEKDTSVQITSEDNIFLISAGTASKNNIKDLDISETVVTYTNNNSTNVDIKETKTNKKEDNDFHVAQITKTDEPLESTSVETSSLNDDSADSDDEASFGTPDDSPKAKRKPVKGKYGKAKAPPPPKIEQQDVREKNDTILDGTIGTTSLESLTDLVNQLPDNAFKESGTFKVLQVVNPIAEKKRRHKAKSPARIPKGQSSGIGKLLQLPSKLAFWQKSDDKSKSDTVSISSEDHSRRSSTAERLIYDEFQSCTELSKIDNTEIIPQINIADDKISFKDATDLENEAISQDIIDKSDALEKLIAAKLESHPEYKYIPLHDEIPTTSKSTDV